MYMNENEADVSKYLFEQNSEGKSLRNIANDYGVFITHADIQRAIEGQMPKGTDKRLALGLSPLVLVSASVEIPAGVKIPTNAKILLCECGCGTQFIRTSNAQKYFSPEHRKGKVKNVTNN